jgi:hypothetical protein
MATASAEKPGNGASERDRMLEDFLIERKAEPSDPAYYGTFAQFTELAKKQR